MLRFYTTTRRALSASHVAQALPDTSPSRARGSSAPAISQGKGLAHFLGISTTRRRTGVLVSNPGTTLVPSGEVRSVPAAALEATELANDILAVSAEFLRYQKAGLVSGAALHDFDLVRFWDVSPLGED